MAWARLEGFWLLSSGIVTVIEGVNVFLNIAGGHRCMRVFKLPVYLGAGARLAVLFGYLYTWDLLLLEGPFYLIMMAFYKVSIGFLYRSSRDLKEER